MHALRLIAAATVFSLASTVVAAQDWADAPDPPYRSTQARGGAVHQDTRYEWLGATVTNEPDARPANSDADDGVNLQGPYARGTTAQLGYLVRVTDASSSRYGPEPARQIWVHGFADWNGDGDFDDPGEALFATGIDASTFPAGRNQQDFTASFLVPDQPLAAVIWFRIRLDHGENLASPYGSAAFGEVEDWRTATLVVPDQHATIQRAIDVAEPGDVVLIRPGTYAESVVIRKEGIALVGTPGATVLRGRGTGSGVAVVHVQAQSGRIIGLVLRAGAFGILAERPTTAAEQQPYKFDIWKTTLEGNNVGCEVDIDGLVHYDEDDVLNNLDLGIRIKLAADARVERSRVVGNNRFGALVRLRNTLTVEDSFFTDHSEANMCVEALLQLTLKRGEYARGGTGLEMRAFLDATILETRFLDHDRAAIILPKATAGSTLRAREVFCQSQTGWFFAADQRVDLTASFEDCEGRDLEGFMQLGAGLSFGKFDDKNSKMFSLHAGVYANLLDRTGSIKLDGTLFHQTQGLLAATWAFDGPGTPRVELVDVVATSVTGDAVLVSGVGDGILSMRSCRLEGSGAQKTGVLLDHCDNVTIDGCRVDKFKAGGITMKNCGGSVSDTTVTHSDPGITLDACASLILGTGNTVDSNDGDGIVTTNGCTSVTILGSNITGNRGNGIRIGTGSSVTVRDNEIVGNGAHGVYDTGVQGLVVRDNKICCNALAGVAIAAPVSATIHGNILQANGTFEVDNRSPASIDATGNDWGPATTVEMRSGATNISRIFDCRDASSSGCVAFRPWSDPTNTCEPDCFLLLGAVRGQWPIPFSPGDSILVEAVWVTGVTMATVPRLPIPADAALRGVHIYFQVYLHNPQVFPLDPVKTSNGLDVHLDMASTEYGPRSGLTLWAQGTPSLGSTLVLEFRIGQ